MTMTWLVVVFCVLGLTGVVRFMTDSPRTVGILGWFMLADACCMYYVGDWNLSGLMKFALIVAVMCEIITLAIFFACDMVERDERNARRAVTLAVSTATVPQIAE